jgi:hypothetical protein
MTQLCKQILSMAHGSAMIDKLQSQRGELSRWPSGCCVVDNVFKPTMIRVAEV